LVASGANSDTPAPRHATSTRQRLRQPPGLKPRHPLATRRRPPHDQVDNNLRLLIRRTRPTPHSARARDLPPSATRGPRGPKIQLLTWRMSPLARPTERTATNRASATTPRRVQLSHLARPGSASKITPCYDSCQRRQVPPTSPGPKWWAAPREAPPPPHCMPSGCARRVFDRHAAHGQRPAW